VCDADFLVVDDLNVNCILGLSMLRSYKCKNLNSLKQCLTATRPTSHN